ncbi:MAG: Bacterial alpha-L-rhamnosidase [Chitinivibrionales bacterium]|nr:Bacterial alpha-L-rhamnosidase [Chitinivibrionales bacterium]
MPDFPCIWIDKPKKQRLTHVYFRRSFSLPAKPRRAVFNLYAQTSYHLRVNGVTIGYGPARAYNDFPEYDSYDIAPYLKKGTNVIGVQVAHDGSATFHHLRQAGLFVAWGDIKAGGRSVSLGTNTGWRCHRSRAVEPNPLPFSFAIGPIQLFDERKAPLGWDQPGTPAGAWEKPVAVPEALEGKPRPRSIPHLTQDEKTPLRLLGAWKHDTAEQILSFSLPDVSALQGYRPPASYSFAYAWIYSPRVQKVQVGNWWGDPALNGRLLTREVSPEYSGREEMVLNLKKGWNFFATYYRSVNGIWDMHLGVPRSAKLTISADRKRGGKPSMMVAGPLAADKAEAVTKRWPRQDAAALAEALGRFRRIALTEGPVTPSRGLAWVKFARALGCPPRQTNDLVAAPGVDTSFVFDMGSITLGRIFVEFEAPRGTVIDIAYAEEMHHDRPNIYKNVLVNAGERHIAAGGVSRMETFAPRGFRFLQVGVRNHRGQVHIRRVGAVSQVYPYVKRGSFECSDPLFNILWAYGWHTLQLCSEDIIADCPWRERTLYGGDLLPEAATALVTSGDMRLVKRCVEVFLQSQSEETGWLQSRAPAPRSGGSLYDYPLIVLLIAEWYCRLFDDKAFARRCYPVFKRMMSSALQCRDATGLFTTRYPVFIMHGYRTTRGRVCALNALTARSFDRWGAMLDMLKRPSEADSARTVARDTERLLKRFWDPSAKAFTDALPPDNPQELHTVPANSWPLLFCSVSPTQRKGAVAEIARRVSHHDPHKEPESISTYGSFYMLGGLYEAGEAGLAEESMRRVYSLTVEQPTGTIWEHANPTKSLTHAWSTAPNYYLSTRALGVRLGFPDNASPEQVVIAPESETLSWARGTVPHPCGDVAVEWRVVGNRLELSYAAPEGVRVTVTPRGRLGQLELDARRLG